MARNKVMAGSENNHTLGVYVVGVLILGGIGLWLGGGIGFVIGAAIAIGAIKSSADKNEEEKEKSNAKVEKVLDYDKKAASERNASREAVEISFYSELVPELLAVCISADGAVEDSEVETATLLIENDEHIINKQLALESLSDNIESFEVAFKKSAAVFKLKVSPIIHKATNIEDALEKDRIFILLDSLIEAVHSGDKSRTADVANKIKEKLNAESVMSKQKAAEDYIRKSGDPEAIGMLNQMKKGPGQYAEQLRKAAKGNSVMKTAFGVFTGMIAADLVIGAINQYQLEQALSSFNAELESIGGIDNLNVNDTGQYLSETSSDYSSDSFSDDGSIEEANFGEEYASADNSDSDVDGDEDVFSDLFS
jgi:hypothetical protein